MISRGRGTPRRTCDVCGRLRDVKPGVFRQVGKVWVCSFHGPSISEAELDATPLQIVTIRPQPDARPFNPRDTFERAEGTVLRFVSEHVANAQTFDVTATPPTVPAFYGALGPAWTIVYLAGIVAEDERPRVWIDLAKVRIRVCADFLLSRQWGGSTLVASSAETYYGGVSSAASTSIPATFYAFDAASVGLALLRAYQAVGDAAYIAGAIRAAWFLRTVQATDAWTATSSRATSDAAGTSPFYYSGVSHYLVVTTAGGASETDRTFHIEDAGLALEFLVALKAELGDMWIGSSSPSASTSGTRRALLSTAIADLLTFLRAGSASPLRARFNAYPASKLGGAVTGTNTWQHSDIAGTYVEGRAVAFAIRGLAAAGETTLANSLFDGLMAWTSNPTFELPVGATKRDMLRGTLGTWNPKEALATHLDPATLRNASAVYDLTTWGLLAAFYSARQQATFARVKSFLNEPQPRSAETGDSIPLQLLGRCGLTYQPFTDHVLLGREASIMRAAMVGLGYRYAPKAFTMRTS